MAQDEKLLGALAWGILVCAHLSIRLGMSHREWLAIATLAREHREQAESATPR